VHIDAPGLKIVSNRQGVVEILAENSGEKRIVLSRG